MNRKILFAAAVGATAVLGMTGVALADSGRSSSSSSSASPSPSGLRGDGSVDDNSGTGSRPSATTSARGVSSAAAARGVSSAAAARTALAAAGGGRVVKIESEREHGRQVWDIEIIRNGVEHDIDVDKLTGKVTDHDTKSRGNDKAGKRSGSDDRAGDDKGGRRSGRDDD
jgi:hypothetical protein